MGRKPIFSTRSINSVQAGSGQAWKKDQIKKKWRSILAVFITVTLLFAIVNGLAKGFSFKDKLSESGWDGKSSFVVAIDSGNSSVFIYQPDPKRLAVLTIPTETIYETGNFSLPLAKISESLDSDAGNLTTSLSHVYGVKVDNYLNFLQKTEMDKDLAKNLFLDFASMATPLKLLTSGWKNNVESTNITRIDALRLWWQVKNMDINGLILADLSKYTEEIIDKNSQKVLGADSATLNRIITEYTENLKVLEEKYDIKIVNGTGIVEAAKLAANFVESTGGNVVDVDRSNSQTVSQVIALSKNSYTARYLANIFDCDINEAESGENKGEITVILGVDFAKKYFE